jgi:hypothetical protein
VAALRAQTPPVIDGRLDDEVWRNAPLLDGFVEMSPIEGVAAGERTEARVLYDDHAIYFGIRCFDSHAAELRPRLGRRDYAPESDWIAIDLDTYHDRRSAFDFVVNISGVQSDGIFTEGHGLTTDWDGVWEAQTSIDAEGWSAEIMIPLATLRFPRQPVQTWGFHVRRYISRLQETDSWNLIRVNDTSQVGRYEELVGLEGLKPGLSLQLIPYGVMTVHASRSSGNLSAQGDTSAGVGLDAKYALTSSLTLDATINPDFAQVEVDPEVVNLSAFEIQFPEKRPFFLEGLDIFNSYGLIYTRRIGAPPPVPAPQYGGQIVALDPVARILGAVKLTGNARPGTAVGVIGAFVDETTAIERDAGPLSPTHVLQASPQTWFQAVRVRQLVGGASFVGAYTSSVLRIHPENPDLWQDAHMIDVDFDVRGASDWGVGGVYGLSITKACDPRLSPSYHGHGTCDPTGGHITGGKLGGEWQLIIDGDYTGPETDINDISYFPRFIGNGDYAFNVHGIYARQRPWHFFKSLRFDANYGMQWDPFVGAPGVSIPTVEDHVIVGFKGHFNNDWNISQTYSHFFDFFDDNETRANPHVRIYSRGNVDQLSSTISTNPARPLSLTLNNVLLYDHRTSGVQNNASGDLTFLAGGRLQLVAHLGYLRWLSWKRWVATGAQSGLPLFGTLDLDQVEVTLRGTFAFSRNLTLQVFSQVLQSSQRYANIYQLADPFRFVPCDAGTDCVDAMANGRYDADFGSLIVDSILRWEFRPGSTLFLVYTHSHQVTADLAALGRGPADNVLAIKLSVLQGL